MTSIKNYLGIFALGFLGALQPTAAENTHIKLDRATIKDENAIAFNGGNARYSQTLIFSFDENSTCLESIEYQYRTYNVMLIPSGKVIIPVRGSQESLKVVLLEKGKHFENTVCLNAEGKTLSDAKWIQLEFNKRSLGSEEEVSTVLVWPHTYHTFSADETYYVYLRDWTNTQHLQSKK